MSAFQIVSALYLISLNVKSDSTIHCAYSSSSDGSCSLSCDENCVGSDIQCLPDAACFISCQSTDSCKSSTIHANGATDVSILCSDEKESCSDLHIECGLGSCSIDCGDCDGVTVDISMATDFTCNGDCPDSLQELEFTVSSDSDSSEIYSTTPIVTTTETTTTTSVNNIAAASPTGFPTPEPTPNPTIVTTDVDTDNVFIPTEIDEMDDANFSTNPTALVAENGALEDGTAAPGDLYIVTTNANSDSSKSKFELEDITVEDITGLDDWIYIALGGWAACCIATVFIWMCIHQRARLKKEKLRRKRRKIRRRQSRSRSRSNRSRQRQQSMRVFSETASEYARPIDTADDMEYAEPGSYHESCLMEDDEFVDGLATRDRDLCFEQDYDDFVEEDGDGIDDIDNEVLEDMYAVMDHGPHDGAMQTGDLEAAPVARPDVLIAVERDGAVQTGDLEAAPLARPERLILKSINTTDLL